MTVPNHFGVRGRCGWVVGVLLAAFAVLALCNAWLSDDAYITFRVADNFVNGDGLRWNVSERVQVYTHPLWLVIFIPAFALTRESWCTAIILGWVVSVGCAAVVALRLATSRRGATAALACLMMSKSFMDYSSSGLENPLTHLLLVLFAAMWVDESREWRRSFSLGLVASLAMMNRQDVILLVGPALGFEIWKRRSLREFGWMMCGMFPIALWEIFSLVYYGFLVPNTAYAKLNVAVEPTVLLLNGWYYVFHSLMFDHLTLLLIGMVFFAMLALRQWRLLVLCFGGLIYIAYIVRAGGDFMSGRFFSAPFLLAVISLARMDLDRLPRRTWFLFLGAIVIGGMSNRYPTVFVGPGSGKTAEATAHDNYRGVVDERSCYYQYTGLLASFGHEVWPDHGWRTEGERLRAEKTGLREFTAVGLLGYYAGPEVHVIDILALADPLLARLCFGGIHRNDVAIQTIWGSNVLPGHYERPIPAGYRETLIAGENRITDPELREYYDQLRLIISGPIWSASRWRAIWDMNAGRLQPLLDAYENPKGSFPPLER